MARSKLELKQRRKARIRSTLKGTAERPRMTVSRSNRHILVQVVDDDSNRVLASASTVGKANVADVEGLNKTDAAKKIGAKVAVRCQAAGVRQVVFDRNGARYHGRVKALADAAREGGIVF